MKKKRKVKINIMFVEFVGFISKMDINLEGTCPRNIQDTHLNTETSNWLKLGKSFKDREGCISRRSKNHKRIHRVAKKYRRKERASFKIVKNND